MSTTKGDRTGMEISSFNKLAPCPFCGSDAKIFGNDKYSDYFVMCLNCEAASRSFNSREQAAEAWNKRIYRIDTNDDEDE